MYHRNVKQLMLIYLSVCCYNLCAIMEKNSLIFFMSYMNQLSYNPILIQSHPSNYLFYVGIIENLQSNKSKTKCEVMKRG